MIEDAELLRRYAEDRVEAAFAELVRRRVDLVYSVARRQCGGDAHLAEEVTQRVFADLARKAKTLAGRTVISGWLYRSAQFAASDAVRSERRRRTREQEDFLMKETTTGPGGGRGGEENVETERLRPLLDAALGELSEADRDAVALRFLEERPWAEVAGVLGLKEDAARKRVARALDALQGLLAKRGITSTAVALGGALGGQAGVAAPAGLAVSVTSGALAGVSLTGAAAVGGGVAFMSTVKLVGLVAVVAAGLALFEARALREARTALEATSLEAADLRAKVRDLERQLLVQGRRADAAEEDTLNLLGAVQQLKVTAETSKEVGGGITRKTVETRYKRAQELARSGQPADALKEFLWCFDEGMVQVAEYHGARVSFLLMEISNLGKTYPPALDALRERRDAAERKLWEGTDGKESARIYAALNDALRENDRSVLAYDRLPPDDERRTAMGARVFDSLVATGRFRDAALAKNQWQMKEDFRLSSELTALVQGEPDAARLTQETRDYAVREALKNIEVLAGANEPERAREIMAQLLAYDGTAETREKLRVGLAKFGRTDWLPAPGG